MNELYLLLKNKGWTIGSCESLTAGLFTARFAEINGVSSVLKGGIVTYQSDVKADLVGVKRSLIEQYGVVSEPCASAMASQAKKLLKCDLCVSFTGNAGPTAMDGQPVGSVYCAIAFQDEVLPYHFQLSGSRNEIREQVIECMVQELIKFIKSR